MSRLVPCPHCGRHTLVVESHCHHCGAPLGRRDVGRTAAAAVLGLSLAVSSVACGDDDEEESTTASTETATDEPVAVYGAPDTSTVTEDVGVGGSMPAPVYGVPDTSAGGGGADSQ